MSASAAAAASAAGDEETLMAAVAAARAKVTAQAAVVRETKAAKPQDATKVAALVTVLQGFKKELQAAESALEALRNPKTDFPEKSFSALMTGRFFYVQSYEIYGGVAGLYDLGPPAAAIKANVQNMWRRYFVQAEGMLELDCTTIASYEVFDASGHVAKFADLMCRDTVTKEYLRADHVLEDFLEAKIKETTDEAARAEMQSALAHADAFTAAELGEQFDKYQIKSPAGNPMTPPAPFNLMFATQLGPSGKSPAFLRPETAQGMFVNFKRLLEYNGGRLPFAAAQLGQAYRNEIAPKNGLLRTREFSMAEVEHFVDKRDKSHPKFAALADTVITVYPRAEQEAGRPAYDITIGEAVSKKVVDNETLGYFMARTQMFLLAIGVRRDRLRFRQHLADEMAHYACDCYDAEINMMTRGWTECVGIADRSAYDLTAHTTATGVPLQAFSMFPDGPREVMTVTCKPDKGKLGKALKAAARPLIAHLEGLDSAGATQLRDALAALPEGATHPIVLDDCDGTKYEVDASMATFVEAKKMMQGEYITPGVIEPSFGIGRIITAILEHSYYIREGAEDERAAEGDAIRHVLRLPAVVAPVACAVFPLMTKPELTAFIPTVTSALGDLGITTKVDDTGVAIGRRYSRNDELGIPFAVTIDYSAVSSEDKTNPMLTLRERDSTTQIALSLKDLCNIILPLSRGASWDDLTKGFPPPTTSNTAEAASK